MNIDVIVLNWCSDEIEATNKASYHENTTVQQLLDVISLSDGEIYLRQFIDIGSEFSYMKIFPYIYSIERNEILWMASYENVLVIELLQTYKIKNNSIYVYTDIPAAGGPDLYTVEEVWRLLLGLFISYASNKMFVYALDKAMKKLINVWKKKGSNFHPIAFISFIITEDSWNADQLSIRLGFPRKETIFQLKALGYQWNRRTMMYEKTKTTKEIIEKLKNIRATEGG